MSVVVAIRENNRVFIGADSQITRGHTRRTLSNHSNYKVWKVKGLNNCLMAGVGSIRDINIVKIMENMVDRVTVLEKSLNYEYVIKFIVKKIMDELGKNSRIVMDDGVPIMGSSYLITYEDKLYQIGSDGAVLEIDDFGAIGSGASEAIGSLLSTEHEDAQKRIMKAIKASAANDIYVDYPIIIANTYDDEVVVISDKEGSE